MKVDRTVKARHSQPTLTPAGATYMVRVMLVVVELLLMLRKFMLFV